MRSSAADAHSLGTLLFSRSSPRGAYLATQPIGARGRGVRDSEAGIRFPRGALQAQARGFN